MPVPLTRRAALGGGAALLLASCGEDDPPPADPPRRRPGIASLSSLLALELAVIAAYTSSTALLRGDARRYAQAIRTREEEHAVGLARAIRELGGDPPRGHPRAEYERRFPRVGSQADALRFLEDLEQEQVRGCQEAVAGLPEYELRMLVAEIGADEGAQLATIRVLSGAPASPHPFETGTL